MLGRKRHILTDTLGLLLAGVIPKQETFFPITMGAIGALLTLPYTGHEGTAAGRYFSRFGVYGLLSAFAFTGVGIAIWRTPLPIVRRTESKSARAA